MPKTPAPGLAELNIALARALGVSNVENLQALDLQLRPGRPPQVIATFRLVHADGLHQLEQRFTLRPTTPQEAQRAA